jgi:hypothetical protein
MRRAKIKPGDEHEKQEFELKIDSGRSKTIKTETLTEKEVIRLWCTSSHSERL